MAPPGGASCRPSRLAPGAPARCGAAGSHVRDGARGLARARPVLEHARARRAGAQREQASLAGNGLPRLGPLSASSSRPGGSAFVRSAKPVLGAAVPGARGPPALRTAEAATAHESAGTSRRVRPAGRDASRGARAHARRGAAPGNCSRAAGLLRALRGSRRPCSSRVTGRGVVLLRCRALRVQAKPHGRA